MSSVCDGAKTDSSQRHNAIARRTVQVRYSVPRDWLIAAMTQRESNVFEVQSLMLVSLSWS